MSVREQRRRRSSDGVLGKPQQDLRLRILGPAGEARTLKIASRKCTIGAADNCSLRLQGHGLHPVHCMIVRGVRSTVARSLSPGNKLNGHSFADAELVPGDQLRLGSFDLEILPCRTRRRKGRPTNHRSGPGELPAALNLTAAIETRMNRLEEQLGDIQRQQTRNKIRKLRKTIARLSRQIDEQQLQHAGERLEWASEREQLVATLDSQAQRLTRKNANAVEAAATDHSALVMAEDLSRLSAELDDAPRQQQARETEWLAEKVGLESQLAGTLERISMLETELAGHQEGATDFFRERATYEACTSELTASLEELNTRLEQQQAAHATEKEAWETARCEIDKQLASTRTKLRETSDRLAEVERELSDQEAATAAVREGFEQERADLTEQRDSLVAQLAEREEALRDSREHVEQWERECKSLASRAGKLEEHISVLSEATVDSTTISDSVEEVPILQQELAKLRASHGEKSEEWHADRQRLVDELESSQQKVEHHQQRFEAVERDAALKTSEWGNERRELKAAVREASEALREPTGDSHL